MTTGKAAFLSKRLEPAQNLFLIALVFWMFSTSSANKGGNSYLWYNAYSQLSKGEESTSIFIFAVRVSHYKR
jgi:hypothetical protein